ncbi:MAG TPA: UMP kinase [Candidatus Saccharimonadales bacterium]|nr:UMP kinase [Candidatus Saccharimonadales bacterium]
MANSYKRVLLKISGEQLAGKYDSGFDTEHAEWLAREVKKVSEKGQQVAIMVGGGNIVRGAQIAGHGIHRVTADHMGMLGTMINALALTDIFENVGVKTRCLSNIFSDQVAEKFIHRLANKHFQKGRVVILAGGTGRPYVTTDTAAVNLALELDCDIVLKATKVDGVYDKDPANNPDAKKFESLTFQQAVENPSIKVMDKAAMALAMEHEIPILIFDALKEGNIEAALNGESVGTKIS